MFRCLLFISLVSFTLTSPASEPPALPQEFRGAWVATVANIDWPSRKGLTESEQKSELIKIFDRCVELNLNAVIFQVRPMCDALYRSDLEPWSAFLTGTMGKDPGYDPLAFAVEEAHRRGLELHAWCNPYRAGHPNDKSEPTANHLQKSRPELVKHYGSQIWLNPTHPDVAKHTLRVLADITQRYDIDGIHLDDYFYPYPEKNAQNENVPFDDEDTWQAYLASGGQLTRSDWRRNAVDEFVKRWYQETKSIKPWVKVGISPFGIWRPGHPPGIEGLDQFEAIYADAKKWLNEGSLDYFSPQLYWPIAQEKQSYPKLLSWWASENTKQRHLWPGNIPSRLTSNAKGWAPDEITNQILVTRKTPGASGNIHFSMKALMRESGPVADSIASTYASPALVPASPWLGKDAPTLKANYNAQDQTLNIDVGGTGGRFVILQSTNGQTWQTQRYGVQPNPQSLKLKPDTKEAAIAIQDRFGNLSQWLNIKM